MSELVFSFENTFIQTIFLIMTNIIILKDKPSRNHQLPLKQLNRLCYLITNMQARKNNYVNN